MARGDKRGPRGRGSLTGRGLGYCAGNVRPGCEADAPPTGRGGWFGQRFHSGAQRGYGRGGDFGRGYGKFTQEQVFEPATGIPQALANELAGLKDYLITLEDRVKGSIKED